MFIGYIGFPYGITQPAAFTTRLGRGADDSEGNGTCAYMRVVETFKRWKAQ